MAKVKVKVVTGYVPIPGHPRAPGVYEKLGQQLSDALGTQSLAVYYSRIPDLWLTQFVEKLPPLNPPLSWSKGDNPAKNSLEYHCVQHEKFAWLKRAADEDSEPDTFVWMDYGIMYIPGMTNEVVRDFLARVKKNDFAIPGCWAEQQEVSDQYPCWRFCGGLMVVPRGEIRRLVECMQAMTRLYIRLIKNVTWEVNTMARIEPMLKKSNFRWYMADHNASMFARY